MTPLTSTPARPLDGIPTVILPTAPYLGKGLATEKVPPGRSAAPVEVEREQGGGESRVEALSQVLADAIAVRKLYEKSAWDTSETPFYPLAQLFDKHHAEQNELIDALAERTQDLSRGSPPPEEAGEPAPARQGLELPAVRLARLLEAHEALLQAAREAARGAAEVGDDTTDRLVSQVIHTNERQVWFLAEHLMAV